MLVEGESLVGVTLQEQSLEGPYLPFLLSLPRSKRYVELVGRFFLFLLPMNSAVIYND